MAVAAILTLSLTACGGRPQHYAGTYPGQKTDVSAADAFRHYGLTLPRSARSLGYSALSSDDLFPLVADFSADCADVSRFLSAGKLKRLPSDLEMNGAGAGIEAFAARHGWSPKSSGNSWYERYFAVYQDVDVLVHRGPEGCRVYVAA